jgi:hypothetical protein
MNHFGRKGGPQGVQHGQNVDDLLGDGAAQRTEMTGGRETMPMTLSAMPPTALWRAMNRIRRRVCMNSSTTSERSGT